MSININVTYILANRLAFLRPPTLTTGEPININVIRPVPVPILSSDTSSDTSSFGPSDGSGSLSNDDRS